MHRAIASRKTLPSLWQFARIVVSGFDLAVRLRNGFALASRISTSRGP